MDTYIAVDFCDVLPRLVRTRGTTWHAVLDPESVALMDRPVSIEIETRSNPDSSPVPYATEEETILAQSIVENIESVVRECERMLDTDPSVQHLRENPDIQITNPHIWISRETMQEEGPNRWAFVVGINVNPDFAWHIEFDGLTALEIWAGD